MTSVRLGCGRALAPLARPGLVVLVAACTVDQFAVEYGAIAVSVTTSGTGTDPTDISSEWMVSSSEASPMRAQWYWAD